MNSFNPLNLTVPNPQALIVIQDDDAQSSLTVNDPVIVEGTGGTTTLNFLVTLNRVNANTVTVDYLTSNQTAQAPIDYTAASGSLTFAPGETSKTVSITIAADSLDEGIETFALNLLNPTNAVIADPLGIATIMDDDLPPSISIDDAGITEGNAGAKQLITTIRLNNPSSLPVTVDYTTLNESALAGEDFLPSAGTVTFAPGEVAKTISITINGDTTSEGNETFAVVLANPTNASIGDPQATLTITNDDAQVGMSIQNASILEGNAGTTPLVFTVLLAAPSQQTISVDYSTTAGTATAGADFQTASGTLTFAPGQVSRTITIGIVGDTIAENDETFTVTLANPVNTSITNGQALGTITNDDVGPGITISDVSQFEGGPGGSGTLTFAVQLTVPSAQTVTVNFQTANGTATSGSDYTDTLGTLTFAPGETLKTISVPILGDAAFGPDESFFVNLSGAVNALIADPQGLGTILNDDALPRLTLTGATVTEGDAGTSNAAVVLTLTGDRETNVSLSYATADGSALAGADYSSTAGNLVFTPAETQAAVLVPIVGDLVAETTESFNFNAFAPVNINILQNLTTVTIQDNDARNRITVNDPVLVEGTGGNGTLFFTVTLTRANADVVTVDYLTNNQTAQAATDYLPVSDTLTFNAGETSKTVSVNIVGDAIDEPVETFALNLQNAVNALIDDALGEATILDDDLPPAISMDDASITEGNAGTKQLTTTIRLNNPSSLPVTVDYTTLNQTAIAGEDYLATNGIVTFAPGETAKTISITINGDITSEGDETFAVVLTNPTNATIADPQAVLTITNDDALTGISILDAAVAEGNAGVTALTFTVQLAAASQQTVTVNFQTASGTATEGVDYVANAGTLTFNPGVTTRTITVNVNGDIIPEDDETFTVTLTNPANTTITDGSATGRILNDDAGPGITIADASMFEGAGGATANMIFTVQLAVPSAQTVTVNYSTANGTATSGSDYTATTGTLTFAPGVTQATIAVPIVGDNAFGLDETFVVNLSQPTNAILNDPQALGTILNDDLLPQLTMASVSVTEPDAGQTNANLVLTLNGARETNVSVDYTTTNGTAMSGSDYAATTGTATFTPQQNQITVAVPILGDVVQEPNETFTFDLSNPVNIDVNQTQALITIQDNDSRNRITINDANIVEGTGGNTTLQFVVTLNRFNNDNVTVDYTTGAGSALAPSDFLPANGTLTFAPGETAKTINVTIVGDSMDEPLEQFVVNLLNPVNALIDDAQGDATILDDDLPATISIDDASISEGNSGTKQLTTTIRLNAASSFPITVDFATQNQTAIAGEDYFATNGTVTFAPGETAKTISITINGDITSEADETFALALTNPTNATIADPQAVLTITNDDAFVGMAIQDASIAEGNAGVTALTFTVQLAAPSQQTVTVNYQTAGGTATEGVDYNAASGTLTFAPGVIAQTLTVNILGDTLPENDETFTVTLSNPVNTTISDGTAVGRILNDDAGPGITITDSAVFEGAAGVTTPMLFAVQLSAPSAQTITVDYVTANGTATANSDYTAAAGTLTFAPGETLKTISVPIIGDNAFGLDENFFVNLGIAVNGVISDPQAIGTIVNDDLLPQLTASSVSIMEGDTGQANANILLSLTGQRETNVSVDYATANVTATAGNDYLTTAGTALFTPAVSQVLVPVPILGDLLEEPNETLTFNVTNPLNIDLAVNQAVITILDNDSRNRITVSDAVIVEGTGGNVSIDFVVTLNRFNNDVVTVNYVTANQSALAPGDYLPLSGTVTFNAGETAKTVSVAVVGDSLDETVETFALNLLNPVNAIIDDAQGIGTILDDDLPVGVSIDDASVVEGNAGTKQLTTTIRLAAASSLPITVDYQTGNQSALAGEDYLAANGTVTFVPGETAKTISITINGDIISEADETFLITLSNPTNAILADPQGVMTITNDDAFVGIAIQDAAVLEGNAGQTALTFQVILAAASQQTVSVNFVTAGATATEGVDYLAASGTVTFAPGQTTRTITVNVLGDLLPEDDELFTVTLSSPVNTTISDGSATGRIQNDDAGPSITIADATLFEGNAGNVTTMAFIVQLSAPSAQTVTVNYATANGTATAGSDYTATNGALTFAPGLTQLTINVPILGDNAFGLDEFFLVNLSQPNNAILADPQAMGMILNDDLLPTLSAGDVSILEGDAGQNNANVILTLNGERETTVSVNYATANVTATAGLDYAATNGTATFAPGENQITVGIPILGDLLEEPTETLTLNFTGAVNINLLQNQAVVTIQDNDSRNRLNIGDVTIVEGTGNTTTANVVVSLTRINNDVVTVDFQTQDQSALAGLDYTAGNGTITFAAGETSKTISITITGDAIDEVTETLAVNLANAVNALVVDGQGVVTINDDDLPPTLSIDDAAIVEGNAGSKNLNTTIRLSNPSSLPITVNYATQDQSALAGEDYLAANGTVTFAPGETAKAISITIVGDTISENDEFFLVLLSNPTNASIADAQAILTITNDDASVGLTIQDAFVDEGNAGTTPLVFTVVLAAPSQQTVMVNYLTAGQTATEGVDYLAASGTITFAPGQTTQTITVNVLGDTTAENHETLTVTLSNPVNTTINDGTATGTIRNDDGGPGIVIADATLLEENSGTTTNMLFQVMLDGPSDQTVSVNFSTANGTAIAGSDYTETTGVVTFAPGVTSRTISIPILGDDAFGPNETFFVNLTQATNGTITDNQAIGTILNDDALPRITISDNQIIEGNAGPSQTSVTLTVTGARETNVSVNYATTNLTATAPSDYQTASGTVTFLPQDNAITIPLTVLGDTDPEMNETFGVDLSAPIQAQIVRNQGIVTILDDDSISTITVDDPVVMEGTGTGGVARFTVRLNRVNSNVVTVDYFTTDVTARSGDDYQPITGTLTFGANETAKVVAVNIVGDNIDENIESFLLNLINPTNALITDNKGESFIMDDDLPPQVLIEDVAITEGNSGTRTVQVNVRLTAPSSNTVTVDYATIDGTANFGSDYQASSGTVTFNPGEVHKTINITVLGDTVSEGEETFNIQLSNAANATISIDQATVTIRNDDDIVGLTIQDTRVTEGNGGVTTMRVPVRLSAPSQLPVSVNYLTSGLSATEGVDYIAAGGILTFAPGTTEATINLDIVADLIPENDETFRITLSNPVNTTISDNVAIGTITDDDDGPNVTVADNAVFEGNEGINSLPFTIQLSAPSQRTITVTYNTANITALAGSDYLATSGTITFNPGETQKVVNVPILGDRAFGLDEALQLNISQVTNARIARGQAIGTLLNDDMLPRLNASSVAVNEGNVGVTNANVVVSLIGERETTVTVDYATANITAVAGLDYLGSAGTLQFQPQDGALTIPVGILGDTLREGNETLALMFTNPRNLQVPQNQTQITILDDDPRPSLRIANAEIIEGNAGVNLVTVTITLSAPSAETITVDLNTSDSTATAGVDYIATTTRITFEPGSTHQTVTIPVIGDLFDELNEVFQARLSSPVNATLDTAIANVTILDDDAAPIVSAMDAGAYEGDGELVFHVQLSAASGQTVTVAYATANITALAGKDYTSISGTLTFNPGQTEQALRVPILDDFVNEPTETFRLTLSNPQNAQIVQPIVIGTIWDDDSLTVTNTNDSGPGSLRQAMLLANASPGTDLIDFDIPGPGPYVISLRSALPTITDPVIIDACTQEGVGAQPLVVLDGAGAGGAVNGFTIVAGNSKIAGFVISAFGGNGILIEGRGGNKLEKNWIGVDYDGLRARSNQGYGVKIVNSPSNTIGSSTVGYGNVISGNTLGGILLAGAGSTGNRIVGNTIGLAALGGQQALMPNGYNGIFVDNAPSNTIGGIAAGDRNRISGNESNGIHLFGPTTIRNRIQGNTIQRNRGYGILQTHVGRQGNVIPTRGTGRNTITDNGLGSIASPRTPRPRPR